MLQARLLVLLTDIDGVYDRDPARPGARRLAEILDQVVEVAGVGGRLSPWGSGGIGAKLRSARIASSGGVEAVIASGLAAGAIAAAAGGGAGTRFPAASNLPSAYKLWLRHGTPVRGRLVVRRRRPQGRGRAGNEPAAGRPGGRGRDLQRGRRGRAGRPRRRRVRGRRQPLRGGELARAAGRRGLPEAVRRDDLVLL